MDDGEGVVQGSEEVEVIEGREVVVVFHGPGMELGEDDGVMLLDEFGHATNGERFVGFDVDFDEIDTGFVLEDFIDGFCGDDEVMRLGGDKRGSDAAVGANGGETEKFWGIVIGGGVGIEGDIVLRVVVEDGLVDELLVLGIGLEGNDAACGLSEGVCEEGEVTEVGADVEDDVAGGEGLGEDLCDVWFVGFEPKDALAVEIVGVNIEGKIGELYEFFA
ncbi:hypothetical protein KS4_08050 [Poriferisphaera corsica]|uniref:Uncharacterized protein n=1 Tax=Poriferisphaera corsica TaxID=2528020 RepID=A0A517YRG3_9BACT|nr:hypothetical protein KS4_08050 [Poriferisphaera corsica]